VALAVVRAQEKLDHRHFLREIPIPTLAVYGRHDRAYPIQLAEYISRAVRHGEHIIFDESAHVPFLEEPSLFAELVAAFASR
jgi:proline iminopeptidase